METSRCFGIRARFGALVLGSLALTLAFGCSSRRGDEPVAQGAGGGAAGAGVAGTGLAGTGATVGAQAGASNVGGIGASGSGSFAATGGSFNAGGVGGGGMGAGTGAGGSGGAGGFGVAGAGAAGTGAAGVGAGTGGAGANTNVSLGGAQDFGAFRAQIDQGIVPRPDTFDAAGFFAEHHTALPEPSCGERVCLQAMLGVLGNMMNGANCTMLQLGLNSPIAANPSERPPLRLAVVIDVSGSMESGDKLGFVQQGLGLLIDGMLDGDELALITYSDNAQIVAEMGEVALRRAQLRGIVDGLVAGGSTNLFDGLELGYQELLSGYDSGRQNRVILLSDGLATAGQTGMSTIMDMSRSYNSDGMGLSTVGLGVDFDATLMRSLAEQGDGNTYFLENSGAVSEVFTEELSYFTVPVAFDLQMEVRTGEHYTLGEAYGSSFWENTSEGGVLDVPSVFLAHRESADDVTMDGGRRGGGSALMLELNPTLEEDDGSGITDALVATVDVSFREPGTNALVTDSVDVRFPMPPWVTPAQGFFDSPDLSIIQKSFVMLNIYVAFEMATVDYYARNLTSAVQVLDRVIAGVEDYNEEVQDTDMDYNLEMLNDLRDLILNEVDPPPPPDVEDPWPAD
jgi:Ca-activated chloride channel family protein